MKAIYIAIAVVALSGCASPRADRGPLRVPPGKFYPGNYINITAPQSAGWYLVGSSDRGMSFARSGNAPGESFVAEVVMFPLGPTDSPEEFEALIVKQASSDANTERFTTTEFTHTYSAARGYPCVQIHNVSTDRQAQVGGGRTETLILENEHLYCRHPIRTDTGFLISYSHRGRSRYPALKAEALSFEEGIQVPGVPAK